MIFLFIGISRNRAFLLRWGTIYLFSLLIILFGFNPILSKFVNKNQKTNIKYFSDKKEFDEYFHLVFILKNISNLSYEYYVQYKVLPQSNHLDLGNLQTSYDEYKKIYEFEILYILDTLQVRAIPISEERETLQINIFLQ